MSLQDNSGSAGQQIEVPDLKKDGLLLSGLTIGEVALKDGKPIMPSVEKAENGFVPVGYGFASGDQAFSARRDSRLLLQNL